MFVLLIGVLICKMPLGSLTESRDTTVSIQVEGVTISLTAKGVGHASRAGFERILLGKTFKPGDIGKVREKAMRHHKWAIITGAGCDSAVDECELSEATTGGTPSGDPMSAAVSQCQPAECRRWLIRRLIGRMVFCRRGSRHGCLDLANQLLEISNADLFRRAGIWRLASECTAS